MKEQLISFETAKLAKEKGYSNGSGTLYIQYHESYVYDEDPNHPESYKKNEIRMEEYYTINNSKPYDISNEYYTQYEAPTQSLLQKWLREEHKIYIEICHSYRDLTHYTYHVYTNWEEYSSKMMKAFNNELKHFLTYEEALEAGLQKALSCI